MNFADRLREVAAEYPDRHAVLFPKSKDSSNRIIYENLSFSELNDHCRDYANGLSMVGVEKGMRVLFLVRPGLDFLPLIFALLRVGAIPVLIDPGMGRRNLLNCIRQIGPEAMIGIPKAHLVRMLFANAFRSIRTSIVIGRKTFGLGDYCHHQLRSPANGSRTETAVVASDTAVIVFTTGSTGPPKGVVYTHAMFNAQAQLIKEEYGITADDVDMPGFLLFAIFSVVLGMTVVIPDMDPTQPAKVNPERIVEAIHNNDVTFSFGSPALWNAVSAYCLDRGITFPTLKRILMAGAPIPWYLHERLLKHILPADAEIYTPYGATETLLTTSFQGSAVLAETMSMTRSGRGYCVGSPYPGIQVKIIRITDEPIEKWTDVEEMKTGDSGEIVVKGASVSPEYVNLPEQTRLHKIHEDDGSFWHRIGDIGYIDGKGRVWFQGRKSHRVETGRETLFSVCCEAIYNEHADVSRSALVGIGADRYQQTPVIIIEPYREKFPRSRRARERFRDELLRVGGEIDLTKGIEHVLFHRDFPVDIRHNAKIFREQLAIWAESRLSRGYP